MITIITGPVKAGKSKKLIETYNQLKDCGVAVFSSKFSLTNGEEIKSRYGTEIKATPISSLFDIPCHIGNKPINYVLVDEFQFLQMTTAELKAFIDEYYYKYDLFLFGISNDYRRVPFNLMANAMAVADKIEILHGICDICKQNPSDYSLRLVNGEPADIKDNDSKVILFDGNYDENVVEYKSVCKECWKDIYYKDKE